MLSLRARLSELLQVLEEQLGRRGDAVAPLEPMLQRTLADIQERLTFRAQVGRWMPLIGRRVAH